MAIFLIAVGGGLGALMRYGIGLYVTFRGWRPWCGTLFINAVGALMLGMIIGSGWDVRYVSAYHFAAVGFLGGFTTFSTLSVQLAAMIRKHHYSEAVTYVALTVGSGLLLAAIGYQIIHF